MTPKTPPWYVYRKAHELLCPPALYKEFFKNHGLTREEFTEEYIRQTFSKLNPYDILEKYDGYILLSWYKKPYFDVRDVFRTWVERETGILIPEATKEYIKSIEIERI